MDAIGKFRRRDQLIMIFNGMINLDLEVIIVGHGENTMFGHDETLMSEVRDLDLFLFLCLYAEEVNCILKVIA
jgi:hypothetical protein